MSRELNPNLRAPRESDEKKSAKPVIGDGGASWLRRAFKRAEEQAQRLFLFDYFDLKSELYYSL